MLDKDFDKVAGYQLQALNLEAHYEAIYPGKPRLNTG